MRLCISFELHGNKERVEIYLKNTSIRFVNYLKRVGEITIFTFPPPKEPVYKTRREPSVAVTSYVTPLALRTYHCIYCTYTDSMPGCKDGCQIDVSLSAIYELSTFLYFDSCIFNNFF